MLKTKSNSTKDPTLIRIRVNGPTRVIFECGMEETQKGVTEYNVSALQSQESVSESTSSVKFDSDTDNKIPVEGARGRYCSDVDDASPPRCGSRCKDDQEGRRHCCAVDNHTPPRNSKSKTASVEPERRKHRQAIDEHIPPRIRSKTASVEPQKNKHRKVVDDDESTESNPPRSCSKMVPVEPERSKHCNSKLKGKKVTFAKSPPKEYNRDKQPGPEKLDLKDSNGRQNKPIKNKENCSLVLSIHRIRGLEFITQKALAFNCDCITAITAFDNKQLKSNQVPRTQNNLTEDFRFEWGISEKQANYFVKNHHAVSRDIEVTIQVETDKQKAIKPWSHIVGTAKLPGKKDEDVGDGRWKTRLQPTNIEKCQPEIVYSVVIFIGNKLYNCH